MKLTALRARFVFPVDQPPVQDGLVTIDRKGWIVDVGTTTDASTVTDLGNVALLPAFVNAHTHLEFSYLKKPLGSLGIRLDQWIRLVIAERGRSAETSNAAVEGGLRDSVRDGVAVVGEISTAPHLSYEGRTEFLLPFAEVIGFSRARAESAFAAVEQSLASLERLCGEVGISPHAPYTVSQDLLKKLIQLAQNRNLTVAMHIAESREELELLSTGSGPFQELLDERSMWDTEAIPHGSRPIDYLRMIADAPRALVIHGNYLDDEEHAFLASHVDRMSLVYCPRTHAFFQHAPYPLAGLLNKGVRVALGTDSRASSPDLNLLAEMRQVARSTPSIDPQLILRMGTLAGAEALNRDVELGSITPGKRANLVAVPLEQSLSADATEVLSSLLASEATPSRVWWRGIEDA